MAIKFSDEQLKAIYDSGQNIIVSAGAGSGKTAVLTERIKQILLSGTKAKELLVLTFTNAAAAEMKERVMKKMAEDEQLKNRTSEVDSAYITTFDSFSLSLVKRYHERLNLSSNISIIDKSILMVYKRRILDDIFLKRYESHDEDFEKLIFDLTPKDDEMLRENLLNVTAKLDLLSNRDEVLENYIKNNYTEKRFNEFKDELNSILNNKIDYIRDCLEKVRELVPEEKFAKINANYGLLIDGKDYDHIRRYMDFKKPTKSLFSNGAEIYDLKLDTTIKEIRKLCVYTHEANMKEAYFQSEIYAKVIIDILKDFYKQVDAIKFKYEAFEFNDIGHMAINLVKDNEDIRNELKYSFKEILVDEYQDTNDNQEEFISYIANNNVYMVGDIKQSIYGFRNANPSIFKRKYDAYKQGNGGEKIDLNQNFRSNRPVLNYINAMFNCIMDDKIGQADFINEHKMRFGFKKYEEGSNENKIKLVQYLNPQSKEEKERGNFNYNNIDVEMFYIAKDINSRIKNKEIVYDKETNEFRPCDYRDFAILCSDGKSFDMLSKLLTYEHIPNLVFRNVDVSHGEIVQIIKNIVKLITFDLKNDYKNDFLRCFYGVARSFLVQYSDETLFDLISNKKFKETLLFERIQGYSKIAKTTSLHALIEKIIYDFDVLNKIIEIGDVDTNITRVEFILNIADSMDKIELNMFDFVEFIDDIFKNNEKMEFPASGLNENKVKLMTIHKSKGLEFPIVYFMANYKGFNIKENSAQIIYNPTYGLMVPYNIEGIGKNVNKILNEYNYILDTVSEKIRLLYVALTRAREQMIILHCQDNKESSDINELVPLNIRENYRSFSQIFSSILDVFNDCKEELDHTSLNINDDYLKVIKKDVKSLIPHTDDRINIINNKNNASIKESLHASKEISKLQPLEAINAMKFGTAMHEVFESCDFKNPNFNKYSLKEQEYLKAFLNSSLMSNIQNGKIYKEYEFIDDFENEQMHGIIDLMVTYDDHIDIIDYKLSHIDDEAYVTQLNRYRKYIESKTNMKVDIYLYSILQKEVKEVDKVD